ncbi:hypothetical protein WR25_11645 [Diploscapter pachys]|uniref:Uncharacterized protein n=1 Tax=Diploscapter pachys TaxID=2018661 RepID=A0A2A2KTD8_9BILA|nr:hypothetical protein WR25_11645 [Diploscapter pachys]
MITTKGACKLARKMDSTLSRFGLKTPYWNMQLDEDLANYQFSTIFVRDFFPLAKRFKKRSYRSLPKDGNILMAVRNSGHGQIFKFLHSVALILEDQINENCTESCMNSPFLYCNAEDRCSSRLLPGAICNSKPTDKGADAIDGCFESVCHAGICVGRTPQSRPILATQIVGENVYQLLNGTEEENNSTSAFIDSNEFNLNETSTEEASISPTHQTTSPPTTTPLPSLPTVKLSRGLSARQQLMRSWNRPVNVPKFAFNDTLPFPTVYFPATVIEGEFKKKGRMQRRAVGSEAHSIGSNLPIGYSYDIQALSHASSTVVFRVLDPASAFAVEFFPFVSYHGQQCKQFCLENRQTPEKAIESQLSGKGYYKKRKKNYLLFSC